MVPGDLAIDAVMEKLEVIVVKQKEIIDLNLSVLNWEIGEFTSGLSNVFLENGQPISDAPFGFRFLPIDAKLRRFVPDFQIRLTAAIWSAT